VEQIGAAVVTRAAELEQHRRASGTPVAPQEPAQTLVVRIRRFLRIAPTF
jgi:hypothetical protein